MLVAEAMSARRIKLLVGYPGFRREVRYGENSRIDILLECAKKGLCYVEVRNVHLSRRHGLAEFPDSVTARGTKHLREMTNMVRAGHRAVMLFLIQRGDAKKLALARDVDADYGAAFDAALAAGVEALALRCRLTTEEIVIDRSVPITGRGAARQAYPLPRRVGCKRRPTLGCARSLREPRFVVKIEHEVEGIEKSSNEVEQCTETDAPSDKVVFADLELREALQAGGIARNQSAAAQECTGNVTGFEVMFGGVAELGSGVRQRRRSGREQGDQRTQPVFSPPQFFRALARLQEASRHGQLKSAHLFQKLGNVAVLTGKPYHR